eukprot:TRINITY_DN1940_c0_g1_i1.p2 TRINITY_DN1940_c0_g1~~TRINITY_DN1940_c0_g1_i1.p2  ORF type:complete len:114 (-),score=6.18 TRINITY_DN1940_c0_g1_i1:323-664(-)
MSSSQSQSSKSTVRVRDQEDIQYEQDIEAFRYARGLYEEMRALVSFLPHGHPTVVSAFLSSCSYLTDLVAYVIYKDMFPGSPWIIKESSQYDCTGNLFLSLPFWIFFLQDFGD